MICLSKEELVIYSDRDILQACSLEEGDAKRLVIEPFSESHLQPASYDITLDNSFCITKTCKKPIDVKEKENNFVKVNYDDFILYPQSFVLANTHEYISLPSGLTAQVQGRSSLGRLGLFIQNAGWIDPGFSGQITLELFNAGRRPIKLDVGMRIGQLIFAECKSACDNPYNGKYKEQRGATASRIYLDYKENDNG